MFVRARGESFATGQRHQRLCCTALVWEPLIDSIRERIRLQKTFVNQPDWLQRNYSTVFYLSELLPRRRRPGGPSNRRGEGCASLLLLSLSNTGFVKFREAFTYRTSTNIPDRGVIDRGVIVLELCQESLWNFIKYKVRTGGVLEYWFECICNYSPTTTNPATHAAMAQNSQTSSSLSSSAFSPKPYLERVINEFRESMLVIRSCLHEWVLLSADVL